MKNKSLKAKIAAALSLVPLVGAHAKTFAMDPARDTTLTQENTKENTNIENTKLLGNEEKDLNNDTTKIKTETTSAEGSVASGGNSVVEKSDLGVSSDAKRKSLLDVLQLIDQEVSSNRDILQGVMTDMNDPSHDDLVSNPAVMSLRDTLDRQFNTFDSIQNEVNSLSLSIYNTDTNLDDSSISTKIVDLDRRNLANITSAKSVQERWQTISKMLKNKKEKDKIKEELAKRNALNQINGRIGLILTDCKTMMGDLKKLDPAVTADTQAQLDSIQANVKEIKSRIVNPRRMTLNAVLNLADQVKMHFQDTQALKQNLNEMIVAMSKVTSERVIRAELSRLSTIKKKVDVKLQVVLEERIMTPEQYKRLTDIKNTINGLFSDARSTLENKLRSLDAAGSAYDECPASSKLEWHNLVNTTVKKINAQTKAWDATMEDVRNDEILRKTWDPVEGTQLLHDKMASDCAEIRNSKDLNVREKTLAIARHINKVQPGTGTALLPVIRSFLDPSKTTNITDQFGNIVPDRLAPYSFQLTGLGGTGKTSGAILVAEAFGADHIIIASNDLKDQNAFNKAKNNLIAKLNSPSKKPVLVIFDEVDTGTCVATDAAGNRIVKRRNSVAEDVNPSNRPVLDVNGNPARAGTWKFKYKDGPTFGEQNAKINAESKFGMGSPALSSHLQRDERGFVNFSEFIRLLDSGPNGKVLGVLSTSNYRLDQMPAEVGRRIAPTGNEVFVNPPSAKNLADIIQVRFPGLSFSDGYGVKEGAELIGKQAFRYSWTAPKLITNLNQLANAIKDSTDPTVAIPCKGLCKLIAKAETFQNIVDDAKTKKQQRELKAKRAAAQAAETEATGRTDFDSNEITEEERLALERGADDDVTLGFDELLNENGV